MVVPLLVHETLFFSINVFETRFLPPSRPSKHGRWVAGLGGNPKGQMDPTGAVASHVMVTGGSGRGGDSPAGGGIDLAA